jgi:hypothetical protein
MATSKYFTVEVKPILPVATQIASDKTDLQFAGGDLLFDWTSFEIPRGASKLIDISVIMRGAQTIKETDFFFAKTYNGDAPGSLGTGNATADGVGYYKNMLGAVVMDNSNFKDDLDNCIVGTLGHGASADQIPSLVLEGEPESGTNVGYDKFYIGATVSAASFNFSTGILADGAVTSGASSDITVKTVDARNFFDVGDVIHVHDSNTAIGTISSLPDATSIILESANGVAIANEDEIINASPITLRLCFEK